MTINNTDVVVRASSSFISVVESEKMNNKLWTLCEEQKVEIRQHKQETSRLNTKLVQVRYIIESISFRLPRNIGHIETCPITPNGLTF